MRSGASVKQETTLPLLCRPFEFVGALLPHCSVFMHISTRCFIQKPTTSCSSFLWHLSKGGRNVDESAHAELNPRHVYRCLIALSRQHGTIVTRGKTALLHDACFPFIKAPPSLFKLTLWKSYQTPAVQF